LSIATVTILATLLATGERTWTRETAFRWEATPPPPPRRLRAPAIREESRCMHERSDDRVAAVEVVAAMRERFDIAMEEQRCPVQVQPQVRVTLSKRCLFESSGSRTIFVRVNVECS
jgi:hypothetical protein